MFSKKFKACKVSNSFVEGTKVYTREGFVPIEKIDIGDYVLSYNEETGSTDENEVVHLINGTKYYNIVTLGFGSGDQVEVTSGHLFYVVSEGNNRWVTAELLSIGDAVKSEDGNEKRIVSIETSEKFTYVYNLTVNNTHNYFVGNHAILAHNAGCRIPHRGPPRLENGNSKEGWVHIKNGHTHGGSDAVKGDLFSPGTTRAQIEQAARKIVSSGKRLSDPDRRIQTFEKKMVVNGKKARYQITVDSDDGNRIITMFPAEGGYR